VNSGSISKKLVEDVVDGAGDKGKTGEGGTRTGNVVVVVFELFGTGLVDGVRAGVDCCCGAGAEVSDAAVGTEGIPGGRP
jgi:hypothetical protein